MHSQLVDLGYESFQMRRRLGQLTPAAGDCQLRSLKLVTGYAPRLLIADPDMGQPEDGGDRARPRSGAGRASSLDMGKG